MVDRTDEGGDPACWAHVFDDDGQQEIPPAETEGPPLDPCDGTSTDP